MNLNDINVANGLSVSGSATINSLNVLGASTLLSLSLANDLNVNGKIYQNGEELELSTIWLLSGSNAYYDAGRVGIGHNSPTATLDVDGNLKISQGSTLSSLSVIESSTFNSNIYLGVNSKIYSSDNTIYGENPWNTGVNSAMLTNPFIYNNAGNVRIGTINMLHII